MMLHYLTIYPTRQIQLLESIRTLILWIVVGNERYSLLNLCYLLTMFYLIYVHLDDLSTMLYLIYVDLDDC